MSACCSRCSILIVTSYVSRGNSCARRSTMRTRVGRSVEEVGIAERDVLGAGGHLRADVAHHDVERNRAEGAAVDRHDRTVPAQMLAAARRVGDPTTLRLPSGICSAA